MRIPRIMFRVEKGKMFRSVSRDEHSNNVPFREREDVSFCFLSGFWKFWILFWDLFCCRNVIGQSAHEFRIIRDPVTYDIDIAYDFTDIFGYRQRASRQTKELVESIM
jgi:hypothetical protein